MKALIFLGALAIVGLVVTGAIKLQKTSDHTLSIQVDKDIVKQDAQRVAAEGKYLLNKAQTELQTKTQESGQ